MSTGGDAASERRRWFRIACRTAHIAGVCGVVGGVVFGAAGAALAPWIALTALSGALLAATDLFEDRPYLGEVRGATLALKLGLLAAAWVFAPARIVLLFAVVALSSVVSHAPGKVRHRPIGRRG